MGISRTEFQTKLEDVVSKIDPEELSRLDVFLVQKHKELLYEHEQMTLILGQKKPSCVI